MERSRNKSPAKSYVHPLLHPIIASENHVRDHRDAQSKPSASIIGPCCTRHGTQCALKYETFTAILRSSGKKGKSSAVKLIKFIVAAASPARAQRPPRARPSLIEPHLTSQPFVSEFQSNMYYLYWLINKSWPVLAHNSSTTFIS